MIRFTHPIYLLLLIPLIYYTWWLSRRSLADMSVFRSRFSLGLRIAILVMLVFVLAGARMVRNATQQCVIFCGRCIRQYLQGITKLSYQLY